jgi:hypothetical protein
MDALKHQPEELFAGNPMDITDERSGGCPYCGQTNGYANVVYNGGRSADHYGTCETHGVKWRFAANLFTVGGTEADWQKDRELLDRLRSVEPIHRPNIDVVRGDGKITLYFDSERVLEGMLAKLAEMGLQPEVLIDDATRASWRNDPDFLEMFPE